MMTWASTCRRCSSVTLATPVGTMTSPHPAMSRPTRTIRIESPTWYDACFGVWIRDHGIRHDVVIRVAGRLRRGIGYLRNDDRSGETQLLHRIDPVGVVNHRGVEPVNLRPEKRVAIVELRDGPEGFTR